MEQQIERVPVPALQSCSVSTFLLTSQYVPTRRNARRHSPRQEGCGEHICSDSRRMEGIEVDLI
jgi:hypothetical protein